MRYTPLSANTYEEHRSRFVKSMLPNSIAVFHSNDIFPTSADGTLPFKQATDIFYLSGIDQEETILILYPDAHDPAHREILLVRETNEHIAVWEGHKFDKKESTELSGIESIMWTSSYESMLRTLVPQADHIYLNSHEHLRRNTPVETRTERMNKAIRAQFPNHDIQRSAPALHRTRSVKTKEEIEQMQNAVNITGKSFERICKFIKPGVMEYEIEAEIMHEFLRNGSRGHAYTPIIASGASACVLHYIDNDKVCNDGDVILMDYGAEYGNYASDMTRCLPVNGRFTERQRAVYDAVLRVKTEATKLLVPGAMLGEYHKEVGKLMQSELLGLGLIDKHDIEKEDPKWPAYKKYFMHGTSHFIGLDVHDYGMWSEPIQENMAFTVEPGIYIPEENLGIRLENDIIITKDGHRDLFENIPIEAEAIEEMMNAKVVA